MTRKQLAFLARCAAENKLAFADTPDGRALEQALKAAAKPEKSETADQDAA